MALDLQQLQAELRSLQERFQEGDGGVLEAQLDRQLTPGELVRVQRELDGRAFHLSAPLEHFTYKGQPCVAMEFRVGVFWLPLVVLAFAALPVGFVAWKLWRLPSEQWMGALKSIAVPLGAMAVGGVVMMASGGKWPGLLAGGALMAGGGYLAYRALKPAPVSKMEALRYHEGIQQPVLAVESE